MSIRRWSRNRTSHHRVGEHVTTRSGGSAPGSSLFLPPLEVLSTVPFSRSPPPPPVFYGNLDEEIPSNVRNILPFVSPAIRRSNMFVSIAESNLRISRGRVSWSWPLFCRRIWSQSMVPDYTPWYVGSNYDRAFIDTRDPSSFSRHVDFSCIFCACYSFVDRGSPFKKHRYIRM